MKIALVCPHIFMNDEILADVIFSPGQLAIDLANGLVKSGSSVTIFSPGPVKTKARNITGDLSGFKKELDLRGYGYNELLSKHPLLFITLSRQAQAEIIKTAILEANLGDFDIVHVYMNEEELGLVMADFCTAPVVFTHHDPYNMLAKYRSIFPKYKHLNLISISLSQRADLPNDTNWIGNTYHGIDKNLFKYSEKTDDYIVYMGRIIESKGVHLAIEAVKKYNKNSRKQLTLLIAGKHYGNEEKDSYWKNKIKPELSEHIKYVGFVNKIEEKQKLLGRARALIIPSTFQEPFGMVMIEAMACGTPVVGLNNGAIPEVIKDGVSGIVVEDTVSNSNLLSNTRSKNYSKVTEGLVSALSEINNINRKDVRAYFEDTFSLDRMVQSHHKIYIKLVNG